MFSTRRQVTAAVLAAGLAVTTQLAALAPALAAAPAISIKATSDYKPVTGDVLVLFQGGEHASARIHGTITGASAGEVATLYARPFPYTKPFKSVGSITLSSPGTSTPYSFSVTPSIATRYKVELFASSTATTPLATSLVQSVYVIARFRTNRPPLCARPTCHLRFVVRISVPRSALGFEMRKRLYSYFGLRLSPTTAPPLPRWLYLNGGHSSVSAARKISATEFSRTVRYWFTIGNNGYGWAVRWCLKDFVSKDGLGLPGHHGCGASRVLRLAYYLG